jgi:hypothetical protein
MNKQEYELWLRETLKIVWSGTTGACEKSETCPYAAKQCTLGYNLGMPLPTKRFLLCYAWRRPEEMKKCFST